MREEPCSVLGNVQIEAGSKEDYAGVARFHYREGRPVGVMRVFVAWFASESAKGRKWEKPIEKIAQPPVHRLTDSEAILAGVIVECRPVLNCAMRGVALPGRYGGDKRASALRLNEEMRVISRVVVVPQFRGIGVGVMLVRKVLETAQTRYVEAMAVMGKVHPLFEQAGMRRVGDGGEGKPVYYLWERTTTSTRRHEVKRSHQ